MSGPITAGAPNQLSSPVTSSGDLSFQPDGGGTSVLRLRQNPQSLPSNDLLDVFCPADGTVVVSAQGVLPFARLILNSSGSQIQLVDAQAGSGVGLDAAFGNHLYAQGVANGISQSPILAAVGFDTNVGINLNTQGTGQVRINGTKVMTNPMTTAGDIVVANAGGGPTRLAAGAVGTVLTGNGAGVAPSWQAAGGVTFPLTAAGDETFQPDNIANNALTLQNAASAVNGIAIQGSATTAPVILSTVGTDTNVGLTITPKGTGTTTITAGGLTISAGTISGGGDANAAHLASAPTAWNAAGGAGAGPGLANIDHTHPTMLDPTAWGMAITFDPRAGTGTSAVTWTLANRAYYTRIEGSMSLTNFVFVVGTSSGNIDIGIYTNTGAGAAAVPNTKVASKGSTAMPAAGNITMAVGTVNTVVQGQHWLAMSVDNTTAALNQIGIGAPIYVAGLAKSQDAGAFPLSTVGTLTNAGKVIPIVGT